MVPNALALASLCGFALTIPPSAAGAQTPGTANVEERSLLTLRSGETRVVGSQSYSAQSDVVAIVVPSPELISVAVLEGTLSSNNRSARPGEALVSIKGSEMRRFLFDAARLAASLPPEWAPQARSPLDRLAAIQRRQRFWGRLERVGLNAAAPRGARIEAGRAMVARAAAPGAPSTEQRALATETDRLRLAIAYDVAAGIALRAPAEQDALIAALGTGEGDGDLRARWFMAGAIQQPGSGTVTLLYHPLARGWLVLGWAQDANGAWQIASAQLASSGLVDWMGGERPYLTGLVADYAAARGKPGTEPGDLAGMEAGRWITGLAEFMHDPARRAVAEKAKSLIAHGRSARLGGGAIDMMPERARKSYAPIAGFERAEGGHSLLFGSALYPHILIAADFDDAARPALSRITLVNLDNAHLPGGSTDGQ